ncbi:MAG TPA: hypothetical protein VHD55_01510 [Candidatus Paceibacterota bacterium]|nr:hypothetical protein [Candidatus Paceibacterota bacterium]
MNTISNNTKIIAGVIAVVLVGASFWAGTLYAKSGSQGRGQFAGAAFTRGMGTGGGAGFQGGMNARVGGGFTAGEVLSRDASGITLKMADGSTKIVLLSASTAVTKSAAGTLDDLAPGTSVVVTGSGNSDGSITAQSVQIRPAGATQMQGGRP